MTNVLNFKVLQVPPEQTYEWLLKKHYAKRIPQICYAFGLFDSDNIMQGIATFGIPASGFKLDCQVYEFNRLVCNNNTKNLLSFFVGQSLKQLPLKKNVIVSYADTRQGHHGYIYQATNWIYTGCIVIRPELFINGVKMHPKNVYNVYGTNGIEKLIEKGLNVEQDDVVPKHRYFYIKGDRRFKKEMTNKIVSIYGVYPYPKGDNKNYDASYEPTRQGIMIV